MLARWAAIDNDHTDRPKLGVDFPKAWIEAFKGQFDPREALEHHVHAWDNSAHLDWLAETAVDALLASGFQLGTETSCVPDAIAGGS